MSESPKYASEDWSPEDDALIELYKSASIETPSSAVDAALSAAAKRAVGARPMPLSNSRWARWRTPLALAATIVVSSSVVYWNVRDHGVEGLSRPNTAPPPSEVPVQREEPLSPDKKDAPAIVEPSESTKAHDLKKSKRIHSATQGMPPAERDRAPTPLQAPATPAAAPSINLQEQEGKAQSVPESANPARAAEAPVQGPAQSSAPPEKYVEEGDVATMSKPSVQRGIRAQDQASSRKLASPARSVQDKDTRKLEEISPEARLRSIRELIAKDARKDALEAIAALRRLQPDFQLPADIERFVKEAEGSQH